MMQSDVVVLFVGRELADVGDDILEDGIGWVECDGGGGIRMTAGFAAIRRGLR